MKTDTTIANTLIVSMMPPRLEMQFDPSNHEGSYVVKFDMQGNATRYLCIDATKYCLSMALQHS